MRSYSQVPGLRISTSSFEGHNSTCNNELLLRLSSAKDSKMNLVCAKRGGEKSFEWLKTLTQRWAVVGPQASM